MDWLMILVAMGVLCVALWPRKKPQPAEPPPLRKDQPRNGPPVDLN